MIDAKCEGVKSLTKIEMYEKELRSSVRECRVKNFRNTTE